MFPESNRPNRWFIILWDYLVLCVGASVNHRIVRRTVASTQTKFLGYCPSLAFTFRLAPCPTLSVFGESTLKKLLKVNAKRYGHSESIGGATLCNKIGYSLGGFFHYPFIWKSEGTSTNILCSLAATRILRVLARKKYLRLKICHITYISIRIVITNLNDRGLVWRLLFGKLGKIFEKFSI